MTQEWDLTRRIERINGVTARANRDNFLHQLTHNLTSDKLDGNVFGDELKVSVLSRMHPLVKINLVTKETSGDWRVIGMFVSDDHPTYAVFIDCNQPIHRPKICFELISVAEAMGFIGNSDCEYQHHLFSEIMFRVGCCILGHTALDDFEAFGVSASFDSHGVGGWRGIWETYNDERAIIAANYWRGEIYGPTIIESGYERDGNERGWLLDSHAYATEPIDGDTTEESYDLATDLFPEIKPMWREDRPIIYFKKTRVKNPFWIEETRCNRCGQRIIISLAKAQCPKGIPATLVKCGSCKREFQFH